MNAPQTKAERKDAKRRAASARMAKQYSRLQTKSERQMTTPEGVDLKLKLAESGDRAAAFMIDLGIMLLALIVLSIGVMSASSFFGFTETDQALFVIWILGSFLLRNFYFAGFEMGTRGATFGKRIMKIRVVTRSGERLTAESVFGRNAMREIEFWVPFTFAFPRPGVDGWISLFGLIWGLVFMLAPLFNKDRLRVGDLVAGTWVVKSPKLQLQADLAKQGEAQINAGLVFTRTELEVYGEHELHVLKRVIDGESPEDRRKVAAQIRDKIGRVRDKGFTDRDFLVAYYAALRQHLEGRMVMGRRRKDKTDNGEAA